MVLIEDSLIRGNIGDNVDQEHGTYINGTLVTHIRNSTWYGQKGWVDIASGHQLKDKAYLRVYEDLTVANLPNATTPSAMPLVDISAFGFTWSNNLKLKRVPSAQTVRDSLVDLRTEIVYGAPHHYPWNIMATPQWRMPPAPLAALDQVYLSVFQNSLVDSFRTEPHVFRLNAQGLGVEPGTPTVVGNEQTTRRSSAWCRWRSTLGARSASLSRPRAGPMSIQPCRQTCNGCVTAMRSYAMRWG